MKTTMGSTKDDGDNNTNKDIADHGTCCIGWPVNFDDGFATGCLDDVTRMLVATCAIVTSCHFQGNSDDTVMPLLEFMTMLVSQLELINQT